jgi:hypothetical protein
MKDLSQHRPPEWSQDAPSRVSPETFDALSHILGRTIAQGMPHRAPAPPSSPDTAQGAGHAGPTDATCQIPYQWSARLLLSKMGLETY